MKTTTILFVIVAVWAMVTPLAAHHSFSAEYDLNKPLYMDGKVTKVELLNPHAFVFMNVTSRRGGTENWQVEINSATALATRGWKKDTLQPGMEICVEGFPEKKGTLKFGSTSIMLKDTGKVMQTPPGNWMSDAAYHSDPRPIEYTGKTSCSNRG